MHLPTFPRAMPVTRRVQTDFRGYDHRPGCPEGGIYEMTNGSAADAPLFSTRPGRTLTYPTGGGSANGLFAVDGGLLWCTGQTLYFNGTPVDGCTLVNGPKVFAELGGTVLIWPDKVWYRPDMGTFGSAEPSWSGTVALQRSDDSSGARADSVAASGIDTPFRVGDAVTFSGFSTPEDNGTYIIRAIAGAVLVFDPDTFSAVGAVEHITVTRRMPLALHACTYANRIWACAQDTVWCTKLGDPLSWYWYEADDNGTIATAAWSVDVGTPGNFSGCAATGSGVVFLKPDGLWRLYGTKPDNFQLIASAALGTEKNSGRSLVTAAETLYYLSPPGRRAPPADGRCASATRSGARSRPVRRARTARAGISRRTIRKTPGTCSYTTRAAACGAARTHFTHPGSPGTTARSTRRIRAASGASARAARRSWRACWRRAISSAAARTASACCACSCGWRRTRAQVSRRRCSMTPTACGTRWRPWRQARSAPSRCRCCRAGATTFACG